jgi:hypothetical protein
MAQDFKEMYGYGEFENMITQTDIDGVMTIAIQALADRTSKIETLEKQISELNELVNKLLEKNEGK